MKKINLITSLSPEKQYEIQRWFYTTLFLSISIVLVGAYFIIPQCVAYLSLHKEITVLQRKTQDYTTAMQTKSTLKNEYDELHAREHKISSYKMQKKNPYSHVAEIVVACNNGIQLESIKFNKKDIECVVLSPTAERTQAMVKQLNASVLFSHMKIISLAQDGQAKLMRCAIKGNVIF